MAHVLYRFYSDTGQLLYVGITMNPAQRFKSHRGTKDWWGDVSGISIEHYGSREDLANAERRAIRVERPMHNVAHTKTKPPKNEVGPVAPEAPALNTPHDREVRQDPLTDEYIKSLFTPSASIESLSSLFRTSRRETCFGYVTDEEYEKYVAADRARWQAIKDCPLCDSDGYRNMYVCNHSDRSGHAREARKNTLRVLPGGDA